MSVNIDSEELEIRRRIEIADALASDGADGEKLRTTLFNMVADIAEASNGDKEKSEIISGNEDSFIVLLSNTVYLGLVKLGTESAEYDNIANSRPALKTVMSSSTNMKKAISYLCEILDITDIEDNYSLNDIIARIQSYNPDNKATVGYDHDTMYGLKIAVKNEFLDSWKAMYQPNTDGLEAIDGVIVPSGVVADKKGRKRQGILGLRSGKEVSLPFQYADGLYEEFIGACRDIGINISDECATDDKTTGAFRYNPFLQWNIATGHYGKKAFNGGWDSYSSKVLSQIIDKTAEEIAVDKANSGSDDAMYKAQSAYCTSLVIINYKNGLGFQVRASCGVSLKGEQFASAFKRRLEDRERGSKSLNFNKATISDMSILSGGACVFTVYLDKEGYYKLPDFLGEQVIKQGGFKPSMGKVILGRKLDNSIMTINLESARTGWCVPIIAAARSGKGVLTLNIMNTVLACERPVFYIDGKPDMAILFSNLAVKYGVKAPMVVDCIEYEGNATLGNEPFKLAIADAARVSASSNNAHYLLAGKLATITCIKMLYVIRMCVNYNKKINGQDIFVVLDEVFKFHTSVDSVYAEIKREIERLNKIKDKDKKDDARKRVEELNIITRWMTSIFASYVSSGIGAFNTGIKVLGLSQHDALTKFNSIESTLKSFSETVGLKGGSGARIYGRRQESGSNTGYGFKTTNISKADEALISDYRHFALTSGGTEVGRDDIFKPLLVLNECDAVEELARQGKESIEDGPYIKELMNNIPDELKSTFRSKYFTEQRLAASIGFEGSLTEIAKVTGKDAGELIYSSFSKASELATEALKYYGVIGTAGINSVYDYIVSTDIGCLWSMEDLDSALKTGKKLSLIGSGDSTLASEDGSIEAFNGVDIIEDEDTIEGEDNQNLDVDSNNYDMDSNMELQQEIPKNGILLDAEDKELLEEMRLGEIARQQRANYSDEDEELDGTDGDTVDGLYVDEYVQSRSFINDEELEHTQRERQDTNKVDNLPDNVVRIDQISKGNTEHRGNRAVWNGRYNPNGWKSVEESEVDSLIEEVLSTAPNNIGDLAEYMAYYIQRAYGNKQIDCYLAEALARKYRLHDLGYTTAYEYGLNNVKLIKGTKVKVDPNPYVDSGNDKSAVGTGGKRGNNTVIDADRTNITSVLNDKNSIDCRRAGVGRGGLADRLLLNTPKGAERYITKLWDSILLTAIEQGYKPALVTRVTLKDDNMTINGKILILDGIIGGRENVRLEDIVVFRRLFKRFPMINTLRIDSGFLRTGLVEFNGDVVEHLFDIGKRLQIVDIIESGGIVRCKREDIMSNENYKKATRKAEISNAIDMECAAKRSSGWKGSSDSENIWGMRLAKKSMGKSGEAFRQKSAPGLVGSMLYGAGGIVIGTVGTAAWSITHAVKSLWGLGKSFKG